MAITKLLRIKESSGKNPAAHLKKNLFYICNQEKTGGGIWLGGNAGSSPEIIYQTFLANKASFGKTGGTQGFHYLLSFPPGCGITETLACQVAEEFCQKLFKDRHYYVYAVHNDKPHLHVHLTFDSVSKKDGYKFHSPKGDWEKRIQPITDALCQKYHLPTLQYEKENKAGMDYGGWKEEKDRTRNLYDWEMILRDDIDEGIQQAKTYPAFLSFLKREGYQVRSGKYLSLTPPGSGRSIRSFRLGKGYAKEEIQNRIQDKTLNPDLEKQFRTYGNREEIRRILYFKTARIKGGRMTPFQRRFLLRWNQTYFIRRPGRNRPFRFKKDILELGILTDAIRYLVEKDILCLKDLEKQKKKIHQEQAALQRKRDALRSKLTKSPSLQKQLALTERELQAVVLLLKEKKKEQKLISQIFSLFYELESRSQKEGAIQSAFFQEPKTQSPDGQTRITIHQKLFLEETEDFWITRIPYQKDSYVYLPKKDCQFLYGKEILEVYLKDSLEYCVKHTSGSAKQKITGKELKKHYEDKTQKNGRKQRYDKVFHGQPNHPDPLGGGIPRSPKAL